MYLQMMKQKATVQKLNLLTKDEHKLSQIKNHYSFLNNMYHSVSSPLTRSPHLKRFPLYSHIHPLFLLLYHPISPFSSSGVIVIHYVIDSHYVSTTLLTKQPQQSVANELLCIFDPQDDQQHKPSPTLSTCSCNDT